MKKLLLITIVLLLQSFPSFSNDIKNKGLLCYEINNNDEIPLPLGFWFNEANKFEWWEIDFMDSDGDGDTFEFLLKAQSLSSSIEYFSDHTLILRWGDKSLSSNILTINRYNLSMNWFTKFQCTLYKDKKNFIIELDILANKLKKQYIEKLKKRKF